ncbi:hypothetical protein COY20_00355 [Candidatus Shapirobacteria bacterium CG_4_10_14_0_2_um_filter_40_12]|uniref:Mannosyl-glycoprotein endo-beta-N-acetylglucosamidase-like domain-containing protein n=1 Tax=Candidatus Shapirobacteria bacterium CG_4_10_14_0_2_um_filter_40_12 TaxID=1974871 RepID=A0A2M7TUC0_9BACT|nr:MAG: hypothetical protein COY20_00355 [Candidatus Shapirobacteria bacterium CG_4_10_14_0_2_um_filter_40_12]
MKKDFNFVVRLVFVSVIGVNLVILLLAEVWWWTKWRNVTKPTLVSGYQSQEGQIVAEKISGNIFEKEAMIKEGLVAKDARLGLIEGYLTKYHSPLLPYSKLILELSDTYNFEYYWILAIAQQESNLCKKIPPNSFNCWGYGIHKKGTLRFGNYELALKSFAEYLKREYFNKGYMTAEEIMKKYCPSSNGSWAYGVNQFIREIEMGV